MILPLVLWAAAADAFIAPSSMRNIPSRGATEAPELDDADGAQQGAEVVDRYHSIICRVELREGLPEVLQGRHGDSDV